MDNENRYSGIRTITYVHNTLLKCYKEAIHQITDDYSSIKMKVIE